MSGALVPGTASEREILLERLATAADRWYAAHGDFWDGAGVAREKKRRALRTAEQSLVVAVDELRKGRA